jgi:hypothetical protein
MAHKQIEVKIEEDFNIFVDEGLEDVIENFFHWDIETCNCCIDYKGSIWIEFCDYEDWKKFLQLTLRNNVEVNGKSQIHKTLWRFLQEKAKVKLVFDEEVMEDPNDEENLMGTGVLVICVGMTFPKEYLKDFKALFFEAFPKE